MFENFTYESILDEMLSKIPDDFDKREGSIIFDALSPVALEINNMYLAFDAMLKEAYGDTASRDYLIRLGAERGLNPYPASKAIVKGEFAPTDLDVPIGTRFNCDVTSYVVIEAISDGAYKLECEVAGSIGNSYTGQIIPVEYVQGLETANITQILIFGEDEEDTEHFRNRYLNSFNAREFSGNKADYKAKTLAISGVGALKIEPVWNGAGTVRLTILDSNYGKATSYLIEEVQNAFDETGEGFGDGLAPIGHVVTVRTVDEVDIAITMTVVFDSTYSWTTHQTLIEDAIKEYLSSLRENWADESALIVRISQIEAKILQIEGILDVSATTINGEASNLTLDAFEIPIFSEVTPND